MVSAVSAQGALRFMVHDGTVTAKVFLQFCKRLLHDANTPVYLVVDGHPSHRAKTVTDFADSTNGRLRLFFLPGYSPQLNPDEWVWKNIKHDRIGKIGVTSTTWESSPECLAEYLGRGLRLTPLAASPATARGYTQYATRARYWRIAKAASTQPRTVSPTTTAQCRSSWWEPSSGARTMST
jgi:transposase